MPPDGPGLTDTSGPDTDPHGRPVPETPSPVGPPFGPSRPIDGGGEVPGANGGGRRAARRRTEGVAVPPETGRDPLREVRPPAGPPLVADPGAPPELPPDVPTMAPPTGPRTEPAARRPPSRRQRRQAAKLRVRRVKRVVRRIDAWSVLKISLLFHLCLYVVVVVAGVLLWSAGRATGAIENVEGFVESLFSYETFEFEADAIFRVGVLGGGVVALFLTGMSVLGILLFNLISDLVGGIRMTVLEEDTPRPPPPGARGRGPRPEPRPVRAGGRSR